MLITQPTFATPAPVASIHLHLMQSSLAGTPTAWYVSPFGSDLNDCLTANTPCLTISTAIGKAASGDTIDVAAGDYLETIPPISKNLDLVGTGMGGSIIDAVMTNTSVLQIMTSTVVNISGFTLRGGGQSYYPSSPTINGGGLNNAGTVSLVNSVVSYNSALLGGGVYNTGILTLTNDIIDSNSAVQASNTGAIYGYSGVGGGIYNTKALAINSSSISYNTSSQSGGGIENESSLSLNSSTIAGNTAGYTSSFNPSYSASGGGIESSGSATVTASTINLNTSTYSGAGIQNYGSFVLVNSTVTGNSVNDSNICYSLSYCGGGGISSEAGVITVANSTISDNSATTATCTSANTCSAATGGGINTQGYAGGSTAYVLNSILSGNIAAGNSADCSGAIISQGYNLLGNSSGCTINGDTTGNLIGVNPDLGPLQNNGGPTLTMALLSGSPAFDAGNPFGCVDAVGTTLTTDQRGYPRPSPAGGRCDIGAFEYQAPTTPSNTPSDTPTNTATVTPTNTATPTPTSTNSATPIQTPTNSPTSTVPSTQTATVTTTPAPSSTATSSARLTVNPTAGVVQNTITLTGTGFGNTEHVALYWDSTTSGIRQTTTTNALGAFVTQFPIPASPIGSHTIIAVGQASLQTAGTPFSVYPRITLLRYSGIPGSLDVMHGAGFAPHETITAYWATVGGQSLGTTTTDSQGSFSGATGITFTVPAGVAGNYSVYGLGGTSLRSPFATFALIIPTSTATPSATSSPTATSTSTAPATATPTNTANPTNTPVSLISINPVTASYQSPITVTGSNFAAGEPVQVFWDSITTTPLLTTTATTQGTISGTLSIPSATLGTHTIIALGQTSGRVANAPIAVKARVTLTRYASKEGLPDVMQGYGFAAGETVKGHWNSPTGLVLGSTTTDAVGSFGGATAITFTVPLSPTGSYRVY